jgi:hypothetical protein
MGPGSGAARIRLMESGALNKAVHYQICFGVDDRQAEAAKPISAGTLGRNAKVSVT